MIRGFRRPLRQPGSRPGRASSDVRGRPVRPGRIIERADPTPQLFRVLGKPHPSLRHLQHQKLGPHVASPVRKPQAFRRVLPVIVWGHSPARARAGVGHLLRRTRKARAGSLAGFTDSSWWFCCNTARPRTRPRARARRAGTNSDEWDFPENREFNRESPENPERRGRFRGGSTINSGARSRIPCPDRAGNSAHRTGNFRGASREFSRPNRRQDHGSQPR